ncbi:MAG: hypothetical protein JST00_07970 [Deltaproteobacteria bacterium]|nr:hypothetical protein [Deltaproteobacteria bacterium]
MRRPSRPLLRFLVASSSAFGITALGSTLAFAQLPPPPPPPPGGGDGHSLPPPPPPSRTQDPPSRSGGSSSAPPSREEPRRRSAARDDGPSEVPPARTGFQIALRTGFAVPLGEAGGNAKMSDIWGVQLPLITDIGGKITPNLFLGGYLGLGFGSAGGAQAGDCDRRNIGCGAFRFNFGFQIQYHFIPDGLVNPWIGYGLGYELASISVTRNNASTTTTFGGIDFAHFLFGVDFRVNKTVGVGPFMDFAIGQYFTASTGNSAAGTSSEIANKSAHEWFTMGVRVVFFP